MIKFSELEKLINLLWDSLVFTMQFVFGQDVGSVRAGPCLPQLRLSATPRIAPGMEPGPRLYLRDEWKTTKGG